MSFSKQIVFPVKICYTCLLYTSIAKTLMMQDSLRFLTLEDLDYLELKELGRFRQKLVKQRTRCLLYTSGLRITTPAG